MAGILDDAALRELRALVEPGMTASAAIQASARVEGPGGTVTVAWTTVTGLGAVPCAFRPAAEPGEVVSADALRSVTRYLVSFPHGTAVEATQRMVITHTVPGVPLPLTLAVIGPYWKTTEVTRRVLGERVGA